ncbi:uncharacterized protein LOC143239183 [Tachypleus tridentatus]|uniref:uncharacterized protein LOC143239183 n=1 Tax=Tachypleus tridentatus TaxID=6853 RepID=UPI003FD660CA
MPINPILWILTSIATVSVIAVSSSGKCRQQSEANPKRHFYVNERAVNITIEVSNRVSHRLISNILSLLLKEVVGYADVLLVRVDTNSNSTATLQRISGCKEPKNCASRPADYVPSNMINLEMWLGPGFNLEDWINTGYVEDAGPLGPIGRSGWYIPEEYVHHKWKQEGIVVDHWRSFQDPYIAVLFDLSKNVDLPSWTFDTHTGKNFCDDDLCVDGVYFPTSCNDRNTQCATLLADYPATTFMLLKEQIERLHLLVRVVWVGPHLDQLVTTRTENHKPTLFFNWKPNTLTSVDNYTDVAFPHCEDKPFVSHPALLCEFEINQLEKVTWSVFKKNAHDAYHVVQSMFFSQTQLTSMLEKYEQALQNGWSMQQIACSWLLQHEHIWSKWIPDDLSHRIPLYIGGIFPLSGIYWRQSAVVPAAQMAVEAINRNASVLDNYRLELLVQDGVCMADMVMKSFISYVTNPIYGTLIGILGPACSDTVEPIAGVAKHFNTIIISYSAEGVLINNREKYPYFFRTIPENNQFRYVYVELFRQLGWQRVAALTEDGQKYPEYLSLLQDLMQANGMDFITNRKFPRERASLNMTQYLAGLKSKNARIIIGDFYDYAARAIMCEAYKQGMTAHNGFQWFLPRWFTANWYDTDHYNSQSNPHKEYIPCSTKQMLEAIEGHMSLAYKFYGEDDDLMQESLKIKEWKEIYNKRARFPDRDISQYGGYAYDAVWVYALALDSLFKENHNYIASLHTKKTSERFVTLINQTDFSGVSGRVNFVGSSRLSELDIWQWYGHRTHRIGTYYPNSTFSGFLELNQTAIVWLTPDGKKPTDGGESVTVCPLESFRQALGVSCELTIVIANLMGFTLFVLIMFTGFLFFKHKYEGKVKRTEARMRELGLMDMNHFSALDGWEIPRNHIVINRKLGEGAFGTVYGGEAFLDDGWVAVAVKTLKVEADVEEKLTFLSEAEMMKRFDHKNIVQLLGVCTIGKPVYTIMEFMLYGDLKTYLLARRHLVRAKERSSSDEVSDQRLTSMASDIARGLSYLAETKYVHRDLACRNCLVNAYRTVKIADFGMCRPMYDSDYYRFNKRGMLPVRWMAPESLLDGLFTPMSDIWSYGVLLYEIITFGSFPYQGLSNNQVLDFVKGFNTLAVPKGCKDPLKNLLHSCWSKLPQNRPGASEIVEILAQQPELISPCLDLPVASVEVEGTDSIELAITEQTRVHSVSLPNRPPRKPITQQTNFDAEQGELSCSANHLGNRVPEHCGDPVQIRMQTPSLGTHSHYIFLKRKTAIAE